MNNLTKFWNWLDGKKRHLAHAYWTVAVPSITIIWPEDVPRVVMVIVSILGLAFTSAGYGHAAVKKLNAVKPEKSEKNG